MARRGICNTVNNASKIKVTETTSDYKKTTAILLDNKNER